jgi:inorganic phosphate transporter, PiT family
LGETAVALALVLGTMIRWRRIVTTVAERIGKTHLAYAQGAAAELTTMGTIFVADNFGLPVSTTHVLTSGIAGTMFTYRSGLQKSTLRNICSLGCSRLPVCFFLGATIFAGLLYLFFERLGVEIIFYRLFLLTAASRILVLHGLVCALLSDTSPT